MEKKWHEWELQSANTCNLPKLISNICERCRDQKYCEKRRNKQMTIWDFFGEVGETE